MNPVGGNPANPAGWSRAARREGAAPLKAGPRNEEWLARRNEELAKVWAEARIRRSQIQRDRARLQAQMQLRRMARPGSSSRAAAAILEAAFSVSGLSIGQLWLDYVSLGGTRSQDELAAMVDGTTNIGRDEHDLIAVALNERLDDGGHGRPLAYWDGSR